MGETGLLDIYIDADACPVKAEVYRVAERYALKVFVVANTHLRTPTRDWLQLVVVKESFNGVDDWIVEHVGVGDLVITTDIPLADRCLQKGARVLAPNGRVFTDSSIGEALAVRELLEGLRQM